MIKLTRKDKQKLDQAVEGLTDHIADQIDEHVSNIVWPEDESDLEDSYRYTATNYMIAKLAKSLAGFRFPTDDLG